MDHVVVKLEQDLAPIDEGKIDEPIWSHDDMKLSAQKRVVAPSTQQAGRISLMEQGRRSAWLQHRASRSYEFPKVC